MLVAWSVEVDIVLNCSQHFQHSGPDHNDFSVYNCVDVYIAISTWLLPKPPYTSMSTYSRVSTARI